jgi:anti-sigma-K factor RskA
MPAAGRARSAALARLSFRGSYGANPRTGPILTQKKHGDGWAGGEAGFVLPESGGGVAGGEQTEAGGHGALGELAWIEPLGALDAGDRARLAAHLREGCASCLDALRGGSEVVANLAHLFAPAVPSLALRARIERHGARRAPEPTLQSRPPRRVRLASAASWVALGVLALAGAGAWREALGLREELARERSARRAERGAVAREAARAEALAGDVAELNELLRAVAARDARTLALAGDDGAAGARAFVTRDRLVLLVHDLPSAPSGMTYQAWTIAGGAPRSAGTFDTDAGGRARHRFALPAPVAGDALVAVTLEPAGGVPQPTGRIVLAQR